MLIKMFQASGPDAAARLENEINGWLKSLDDPDIEKINTTACPGRDGEVHIVVTILHEVDQADRLYGTGADLLEKLDALAASSMNRLRGGAP